MKKVIPNLMTEYGRYISRYRSIPYYIDCLLPVERRVLLIAYQMFKSSNNKYAKSASIVGRVMAELHPHGDLSIYGTLEKLVNQGLIDGQGNWGAPGINDDPCAAPRYTEAKLSKWVKDLAFKYIDFADMDPDPEWVDEPLALPSPIPLGLIGHSLITGIAYCKPVIPKYKLSDLANRLNWLLTKDQTGEAGPFIKPYIKGCEVKPANNDLDIINILENGYGRIKVVPLYENLKLREIDIIGKDPIKNIFSKLIEDIDNKVIPLKISDLSDDKLRIRITTAKKSDEIKNYLVNLYNTYLINNHNINIQLVNQERQVLKYGIDSILINNYVYWLNCVKKKRINDVYKVNERKFSLYNIMILRLLAQVYPKYKNSEDLVNYYDINTQIKNDKGICKLHKYENEQWVEYDELVTKDTLTKTCSSKSIKQLFDSQIDLSKIDIEINDSMNVLLNAEYDCYQELLTLF